MLKGDQGMLDDLTEKFIQRHTIQRTITLSKDCTAYMVWFVIHIMYVNLLLRHLKGKIQFLSILGFPSK